MKTNLRELTVLQLVDRFADLGIEQDKADLWGDNAKFNRLYQEIDDVRNELKNRPGDQRSALMRLYDHPNMQVRLTAAKSTLAVAPVAARSMLQTIADSAWHPQAGDAGMCLVGLDTGDFVPK